MNSSPLQTLVTISKLRLTETETMILEYLKKHPDSSRYQAMKHLEISYSTTHSAFQRLEQHGLIKVSGTEPSSKNPDITVNHYQINQQTLAELVSLEQGE